MRTPLGARKISRIPAYSSLMSRRLRADERRFGETAALGHVAEFPEGDVPGAGPQAAVRRYMDPSGVAEDLDGVEDPVTHELRRLDVVRVYVEHAQTENRLVREIAKPLDHAVARPHVRRGAKLAAVVVRETDAVLAATAHALDRGEEEVVVREAEIRGEEAVETVDALVDALHEQLQLVRLGRRTRLVDLDPGRSELDQRLQVRADQVARDVERELAPRLDLDPAAHGRAEAATLRPVSLVVRPDRERVRARDRDLELGVGDGLERRELVIVVGRA